MGSIFIGPNLSDNRSSKNLLGEAEFFLAWNSGIKYLAIAPAAARGSLPAKLWYTRHRKLSAALRRRGMIVIDTEGWRIDKETGEPTGESYFKKGVHEVDGVIVDPEAAEANEPTEEGGAEPTGTVSPMKILRALKDAALHIYRHGDAGSVVWDQLVDLSSAVRQLIMDKDNDLMARGLACRLVREIKTTRVCNRQVSTYKAPFLGELIEHRENLNGALSGCMGIPALREAAEFLDDSIRVEAQEPPDDQNVEPGESRIKHRDRLQDEPPAEEQGVVPDSLHAVSALEQLAPVATHLYRHADCTASTWSRLLRIVGATRDIVVEAGDHDQTRMARRVDKHVHRMRMENRCSRTWVLPGDDERQKNIADTRRAVRALHRIPSLADDADLLLRDIEQETRSGSGDPDPDQIGVMVKEHDRAEVSDE